LFRIFLQLLERGAGMEPFMEPSDRKRGPEKAVSPDPSALRRRQGAVAG
jgi:hypothetical protein